MSRDEEKEEDEMEGIDLGLGGLFKGIGGQGDEVYSIPFLDLAMVVSDSPQDEYETTRANTVQHQLVCEEVLKQGFTALPVRFGTVCKPTPGKSSAEGKTKRLLRRRYGEFHSLLGEMENKVELGLKVFWKKECLFQEIAAANQDIREMRDRIAANPSGALSTHYERLHRYDDPQRRFPGSSVPSGGI